MTVFIDSVSLERGNRRGEWRAASRQMVVYGGDETTGVC
jgi:hypothetical protein